MDLPADGGGGFAGLDRDDVRAEGADLERGGDPGGDGDGGQVSVQQQHLDQGLGPDRVAVPGADRVPPLLMQGREHARGAGLRQRSRSGQGSGLAGQDLQIVVQDQVHRAAHVGAFMDRDLSGAVEDDHLRCAQQHPHAAADQVRGHRILHLSHHDAGMPIHAGRQFQAGLEALDRQRGQERCLGGERLADRDRAQPDPSTEYLVF